MAIIQEHFLIGGRGFIRTYSDTGYMIHGGSPEADYSEACDPTDLGRTYTETNIPIEREEADLEEILRILTGGAS